MRGIAYFRAWDDATGKVLWQIRTNNAINGFPVSYSVNGKQYVAVSVGNGSSQAEVAGDADAGNHRTGRRVGAVGLRPARQEVAAGDGVFE